MLNELITELNKRSVNFVKAVDISSLPENLNRGYSAALLIGMVLSPDFIFSVSQGSKSENSEFSQKERNTDELAEWTADFIIAKGYKAYAQSERVLYADGFYNEIDKTTLLPHKTIALLTGLGWIGKNNLLVTPDYGSALSICTVLTNAPLTTENKSIVMPKCGECAVCRDVCDVNALRDHIWEIGIDRDLMVDVNLCNQCIKCLALCPWTQQYMRKNISTI